MLSTLPEISDLVSCHISLDMVMKCGAPVAITSGMCLILRVFEWMIC